jgi:putative ABC transport system permease protein
MHGLRSDIRFALRAMRKAPGFTAVALLTLAIGLGANAAIFSFVDAVILKPLPYPEADRILQVWEKPPGHDRNDISSMNLLDWKHQNTVFQHLAALSWNTFSLSGTGEPDQLKGQAVSACYFDVLGLTATLGRTFAPDEDQAGKDQVVVLSNRIWKQRFGSDPGIVGKKLTLDNRPYNIIGVLPEGAPTDRTWAEIWVPLWFDPAKMTRNFHWLAAMGRMKPGVTIEQVRAEMDTIGARIAKDYPDTNKGWGVTVERLIDVAAGPQLKRSLWVWLASVGAVLLIGCANLANLLLARATERTREIAVRSALGASRGRIVRQLLTESLLLSLAGALAGLALGYGLLQSIKAFLPEGMLPPYALVELNSRVAWFLLAAAVFTTALFGAGPALLATRRDNAESLKEGGRGSTSGSVKQRLRGALVVAEVALACILLTGAGLLIRSFNKLVSVDPGFDSTNVITMGLPLAMYQNTDSARVTNYYRQVIGAIGSVPGVRDAAVTSALPMEGWSFGMPFLVAGRPMVDRANRPSCFFKIVSPSYFQALGMRLRKGRGLSDADVKGSVPVAVMNETMVQRYFAKEEPVGKRILIQEIVTGKHELGPEIPWEIVGIVKDEKVGGFDDRSPGIYVSYVQSPIIGMALLVRGAGDPQRLVKSIQAAVWQVKKDQPLPNVKTLDQIKDESVENSRLRTTLLGVFAGIALLLTMIGIYGVISYSIAQRTHELGLRLALGATSSDVLRLVIGQGMLLAGIGLAIGICGALWLTRFLASFLFETSPFDMATLIAVALLLAAVALLACFAPARRASRLDPMVALRWE